MLIVDFLADEVIQSIMQEEKPNQKEKPAFKDERITKLIPKSIVERGRFKKICYPPKGGLLPRRSMPKSLFCPFYLS